MVTTMKMIKNILVLLFLLQAVTLFAQPSRGVSSEDFEHIPAADMTGALYGKIAGFDVSAMLVHGKAPLILVDGIERNISELNVMDVESVCLLDDAVSAALYGVRGGNGVLLITTRRGGDSGLKVSAQYAYGLSTQFRSPVFADAWTYASLVNSALVSDGLPQRYSVDELSAFRSGQYPHAYADVDWWNEVLNDSGHSHELRLAFDGGGSRFRHHTTIEYSRDRSMLKEKQLDTRLSVRTGMDARLSSSTFLKAGVSARLHELNGPSYGAEAIIKTVYLTPSAAFPVKTEDGIYGGSQVYGENNPVALMRDRGHERNMYGTLLADMTLRQELDAVTEGLAAEAQVYFDNIGGMRETTSKTTRYVDQNPSILPDGTLILSPVCYGTDSPDLQHSQSFESLTMRSGLKAEISYDRTFGRHGVSAATIYDMQSVVSDGRNNSTRNQSVAVSASYDFDGRYSLDAVLAYSGSAYLPEGSRFHAYPAVSAAWVISNEKFMNNVRWLDMLRLGASYGLSGYDGNLSHELWRESYGAGGSYFFGDNAAVYTGACESDLPVAGLVPEKSAKMTLGLDLSAFDERLKLDLDGFRDYRRNVLVSGSSAVSGVIGIDVGQVCEGEYLYKGIDFTVSWDDQVGDFSYGAGVRISCMDTKVINENQPYQEYDYLYHMGDRIGQCYGLEAVGFFDSQAQIDASPVQKFSDVAPGDVRYKDQNDDNVIDSRDVVRIGGSVIPHCLFGFDLSIGYGGFELYADFQAAAGVTVSLLNSPLYRPLMDSGNISQTFLDNEIPWTYEDREVATVPRLTTESNANNIQPSSLWYRDGSYLKLRNLVLSYTFDRSLIRFADMKVFVQGCNLFSIDRIGFADPQRLGAVYPSVRTWYAGVRFDF